MQKIDILRAWYQRVWVDQDLDAIDSFFAPRTGADGIMPDGQVGAEDFRALVPALTARVRDLAIDIDRWHDSGDWLWAQITARALPAGGSRMVAAQGQVMLRFDGDLIAESYNTFDFLTLFSQVGQLPEDALLLLLSGERLG
jgi:SnoaL-like polyketide cyclase